MMWIMLIAMFVIMYFFMIRPQNKKQKEIANFRKSLQVNQNVITAGGIHGTIKEITDDYIVLEIASNVKIKIDKNSIFADASAARREFLRLSSAHTGSGASRLRAARPVARHRARTTPRAPLGRR